jgi:ribosomal protein S27AE
MDEMANPISEARLIAKGSILRIIAVFLISIVISGIVSLIYTTIVVFVWPVSATTITSWYNPATRNFGMIILYELVYSVIEILFAPLFVCLLTPIFISSKARKDLGMKFQFKSSKQQKYQPTIQETPTVTKKGIFCPYCGYKITAHKKYCPNCGKSIDF